MPSLKSRLVAFVLRHTRKKAFASPENLNAWIAGAREREDHRPPARLTARNRIEQREIAGRPVYDLWPREMRADGCILYLHGGAYCFEITSYHWHLIGELAERLGRKVIVPIYPLAPEHDFHDIFAMGLAVYKDVMERHTPEQVAIVGDSAGGNMAVVLEMMATQQGLPLPERQALISPGLDMTLEHDRLKDLERQDPWLGIAGGLEAIRLYAADLDRSDWRISPIMGDLSILPPTLILAGARDLLTPGTQRFVDRAREAGRRVELEIEPGMFHVWPLIDMPEARIARDRIVAYLTEDIANAVTKPETAPAFSS